MRAAAEAATDRELAKPRQVDGYEIPATKVDGAVVTLDKLSLVEFRFVARGTRIDTSASTFTIFPEPTDVWVAVWSRSGVPAPEWDGALTTVRVVVVVEDGSGTVRSLHAGKVNENPDETAYPLPAPKELKCSLDEKGYRTCVR